MTVKDKQVDGLKVFSLVSNGLMLAGLIVSITITVQKAESYNLNSHRIDGLITVTDSMKDVDRGMLQQITELKGSTTADIMVLKERIDNVTKLLEEIKRLVTRE